MNTFDRLVDHALHAQAALAPLRGVVEKELLHHDILRAMSHAGLLRSLTFIGGTCLRLCYGSSRLSEHLDFTGGQEFRREHLATLGQAIMTTIEAKYGLRVQVADPVKEIGRVDTWKVRVTSRPDCAQRAAARLRRGEPAEPSAPLQRIHIDIRAIPSYRRRPMLLRNAYDVDLGTGGLFIQAQSREEILADKLVALAFRPNRLKNRDLWDLVWLRQQGVDLPLDLMRPKIADHGQTIEAFRTHLEQRTTFVAAHPQARIDFVAEMRRFLPAHVVAESADHPDFWSYLTSVVNEEATRVVRHLSADEGAPRFNM